MLKKTTSILVLLFIAVFTVSAQTALVNRGSEWKYLDDGSDQGSAWRQTGFDDSAWRVGNAQLGYGDGDETTRVGYGPDYNNKFVTTYFRRSLFISDPSAFLALSLAVLRDDGVVVYVNGTEVFRSNMPAGDIAYTTFASSAVAGSQENTFFRVSLPASALKAGDNVIAVEIHQSDLTSSDVSFDLELFGSTTAMTVRGPYLQMTSPDSVTLRWRTDYAVPSVVYYGTSQGFLSMTASDPVSKTDHEVRLTGLSPQTRYFYGVGTSEGIIVGNDANHFFWTAPVAGQEGQYRIWVLGDSGTADTNARAVRDSFAVFNGQRKIDLMLMLGDNAYSTGTDIEYQAAIFDMYPAFLRQTTLWSTIGNHDSGLVTDPAPDIPYFGIHTFPTNGEVGGRPSGTEKYYSFDYGNVHIISLDSMTSDRSPGSPMLQWLENDLAQNTKPWVIVIFHHPPYSRGSHYSDDELEMTEMRTNVVPILERYGVDLVLGGHSHSYERSFFIDGHYGFSWTFTDSMKKHPGSGREDSTEGAYRKSALAPLLPNEGTVYVVAGTSGKSSGGMFDHRAMFYSANPLGSMVIDVDNDRLDAKFLTSTGTVADYFTIIKGSPPPPPPPVTIPNAPSNVVFTSITRNSVVVNWQDNSNNEDGFEIQRCLGTKCTNYARVGTTATNVVRFTDSGLSASTNYSYRVRSFNSAGASAFTPRAIVKTLRR